MLEKNKGQPQSKGLSCFYKTLWSKQEQVLHFSSSLNGRHYLSVGFHPSFSRHGITQTSLVLLIWFAENVPSLEVHIVTIDVPVATSHLGIHPTSHHLSTSDIICKRSQQQRVTTEATEHGAQLSEV